MITFDRGEKRFNYRIAGVAIAKGSVLVHKAEGDAFWTFPGGRAEMGEPAEQTLKREMMEELGAEVNVIRPLWFVENFFAYDGKDYHEVALYFLMEFLDHGPVLEGQPPYIGLDGQDVALFQWVSQDCQALRALPLLPSFVPAAIDTLPSSLQHVVHVD
ncbi:MAG: NUDIX hydrolase [Pseudomonadota bacterium]